MLPDSCVLSGCFLLSLHQDGPCDFKTHRDYAPHSNCSLLEPHLVHLGRVCFASLLLVQKESWCSPTTHSQTVALLIRHAPLSATQLLPSSLRPQRRISSNADAQGPFQTRLSVCSRFGMVCREGVEATKLPRKAVSYASLPVNPTIP